jgi:hypothetical protein
MLERQLGKQSGGDMEPITESPTRTEDCMHAVAMPGPIITGLEQNSQSGMHMMSDSWVAQMAGLSQQSAPWPPTTKLAESNVVAVSTEKPGLHCGLTSPDIPLNMTLDEDMGLGNLNAMMPADIEISQLMLSDLYVSHFISHSITILVVMIFLEA